MSLFSDCRDGILILSDAMLTGNWVESGRPEVSTNPHDLDTGTVKIVRYVANYASLSHADVIRMCTALIGTAYLPGMYCTGISAPMWSAPGLLALTLSLSGVCSPKSVKRTFNGARKELAAKNETWTKKLQAEYPCFTDSFLTGPGLTLTPPADPDAPKGYSYVTDKLIYNEPYGWVVLGDDIEDIPLTPYKLKTIKKQWFWQMEPDF